MVLLPKIRPGRIRDSQRRSAMINVGVVVPLAWRSLVFSKNGSVDHGCGRHDPCLMSESRYHATAVDDLARAQYEGALLPRCGSWHSQD